MKSYHIRCPKCNNNHSFYRYGKDSNGYQKYLCRNCCHQFAPERPRSEGANCRRKHPTCPVCGKASFLHHDYEHYSNYRCTDKKCNHSFFVWKSAAVTAPSMSTLFGKHNFKRMRYPIQIIITTLSMFYLGKNSFRNISLILKTAFNIKVSHTTVSNWCVKFAALFDDMRIQLVSLLDLNSDEWHADETVVKIGCSSPALKEFTLECEINWNEKDGKEYKEISMLHNGWWIWIVPLDYQKAFKRDCFDIMRADKRFDSLFERLDKCVIYRSLPTG